MKAFHDQWVSAGRGVANLDDSEVEAAQTREEITRQRPSNEKA